MASTAEPTGWERLFSPYPQWPDLPSAGGEGLANRQCFLGHRWRRRTGDNRGGCTATAGRSERHVFFGPDGREQPLAALDETYREIAFTSHWGFGEAAAERSAASRHRGLFAAARA